MKELLAIIMLFGLMGGCVTQQSYKIPASKSRGDFLLDKEVCENFSGYKGGYFDSGPLIVLFPIVKAFDFIEGNHQRDFQQCMAERGYMCISECWDTSTLSDAKAPQQVCTK